LSLSVLHGIEPSAMPFPGSGMAAALGRVADHAAGLLPDERTGVERMAGQRLAEYSSGRRVARCALREIGFAGCPVARRGRAPAWPPGAVGTRSMQTHLLRSVSSSISLV